MGKESKIAHKYLDGLKGIEIGAGAHNPFGLDTVNVDLYSNTSYEKIQIDLCGKSAKIDIVANGDNIPVPDKSYDFVVSSHVIEHFINPIKALYEWERIARKYIFMVIPHKDRTFDKDRPLTDISEIVDIYFLNIPNNVDKHHHTYTPENFKKLMEFCDYNCEIWDTDDKVGNGFMVLIDLSE